MANQTLRSRQPKKELFLFAYGECGIITQAAERAGITRQTHYDWMANDEDYAAAFHAADEKAIDALEQEARRRAIAGSDTLLIFMLKGNREKYRERGYIEHAGRITVDDGDYERIAGRLAGIIAGSQGHTDAGADNGSAPQVATNGHSPA